LTVPWPRSEASGCPKFKSCASMRPILRYQSLPCRWLWPKIVLVTTECQSRFASVPIQMLGKNVTNSKRSEYGRGVRRWRRWTRGVSYLPFQYSTARRCDQHSIVVRSLSLTLSGEGGGSVRPQKVNLSGFRTRKEEECGAVCSLRESAEASVPAPQPYVER
jgi:hypothetical protein